MKWVEIQLDTAGDENRIIKYADIKLFVEVDGQHACYKAIHTPTGRSSDPLKYHASVHEGWTIEDAKQSVLADCIYRVLI